MKQSNDFCIWLTKMPDFGFEWFLFFRISNNKNGNILISPVEPFSTVELIISTKSEASQSQTKEKENFVPPLAELT